MSKFIMRRVDSGVKFDLTAVNGQGILTSEVYDSVSACRKGIESIRKNALRAKIEDQTEDHYKALTNPKFELYQDKAGQFRFRLKARNGEIIAASEGYASLAGCRSGIDSVKINAVNAQIVEE